MIFKVIIIVKGMRSRSEEEEDTLKVFYLLKYFKTMPRARVAKTPKRQS